MRNNKIIAALIAVSMLITTVTLPVSASDSVFTKIYISDNFADGTDGWIVGETGNQSPTTMSVVDDDGATDGKALKITFPSIGAKHQKGDKYAVYGSVTKQGIGNGTEFSTDKELTIKARVKKTDPAMDFDFKANRPNTLEQVGHDFDWEHYYRVFKQNANANGIGLPTDGVRGGNIGNYGPEFFGWHDTTVPNGTKVDLTGKWVEYIVKFKPEEQKYYVTIKYTDTDGTERTLAENQVGYMRATKPELLKEYGNDFAFDAAVRQYFGGLKSVSFTSRTEGDIYIDYVKIYGERDIVNATASIVGDGNVRPDDYIEVKLNAAVPFTSYTEGMFGIDGVASDVTFDIETQTASIKPKESLTPGETYLVKINSELLYTKGGFNLQGSDTLDFSVTRVNAYDLEITGEPVVDGTLGVDYDYRSVEEEGEHLFQWETSLDGETWTEIDGETSPNLELGGRFTHGQQIRVKMTPVDVYGESGLTITSDFVIFQLIPLIDGDGTNFRKYYVNETFDTEGDTGAWALAETKDQAGQTITLAQETLVENGENIGALMFSAAKPDAVGSNTQPSIYNDFNDIVFNENSDIVIETRVKALGGWRNSDEGNWIFLQLNRPWQQKYLIEDSNVNLRGWNAGTLFGLYGDKLTYKHTKSGDTHMMSKENDEWINVRILIDGTDGNLGNYKITAWNDDNTVRETAVGTLAEHTNAHYDVPSYVDKGNANAKTSHIDLRSLSFSIRQYSNTVYVDYFRVYELRPTRTTTVSLTEGTTIRPSDSVTVKFNADVPIDNFAEGLVTIDDVECDMTSDVNAQTVTLTPKERLTPASTYTLNVSSKVMGVSEGYILEGTNTFTLNVTDVNVYNVETTGRAVPDTALGVVYTYEDSTYDEGTSLYQWQKSSDGVVWTDILGETSSTYTVTEENYENYDYLRAVVTPVDILGNQGLPTAGTCVIPEITPTLDNVKTNTSLLFANMYLTPVYDYIDPNEDKIVSKKVNWYASDSESGPWNVISTDENFYITDAEIGKYFKYDIEIINEAVKRNQTSLYTSGVVGPVVDVIESTNLLVNPGFERGDLAGWNNDDGIIEIAGSEGARTGNYAVHLMPRTTTTDGWPQTVNGIVSGKSYISSCYVRTSNPDAPKVTNFRPYSWDGLTVGSGDYFYLVGNDWIPATGAFVATSNTAKIDFVSFHTMKADCYIDDIYFGELIISDIETFTPEPTEIPVDGTTSLAITSGKVLNQVGTTHGLVGEAVKIRVPDGVKGITQVGNNLVIDNTATAGTYTVEIYCQPTYNDPIQNIFQKFVTLELVANNDASPKARNLKVTGTVQAGKTLVGSYEFYQITGKADASTYSWMYSDTIDGEYKPIAGATGLTYTLEAAYADKFIKFAVKPVTADGIEGTLTLSDAVTMSRPPFVTDASVKGEGKVGGSVEAVYTYNDYNSYNNAKDEEGATTYQWYSSDYADSGFTPILGATSKTYTFTENEIDKYVKVEIKPVSKVAPTDGTPVMSSAFFGPTAPVATNVAITKSGLKLKGSYQYSHTHGARETDTIYKWTVNGVTVSNSISYTIDFEGTKYVEFSVTPVGDTNPSTGKTYSYGVNIEGNPSSSIRGNGGGGGGAGGGGGGGAAGSTGVTNINDMKLPETEVKEPEQTQIKSDLNGHWGAEYVKEMENRGVMKADEKGNYDPDRTVSRQEMISYIFDALKLEEAEYTAEFSDVSSKDDYAGKLQAMINNGTIASYHEFRPEDGISREEMCKILYISLENAGKLTKAEANVLDTFTDKASISDWAVDYVNTIYSNKIMIGTSDTTFAPKENITRAQVATMLVRILKVIEG